MRIPENLSLPVVADVMAALGVPMDRGNVGRALQGVVIAGVEAPESPGDRWRIPRCKLVEVVGACLLRRALRHPDRWSLRPEKFVTTAAELMLDDPDLEGFVPRRLKAEIQERRRLEEERLRRESETKEAEERRVRELRQREAKARQLEYERRERERREKMVLDYSYYTCKLAAREAIGFGMGPDEKSRPEILQLYKDYPEPCPDWWLPPPELRGPVEEYLKDPANPPKEVPDWSQWVPKYVPGRPWPWRKPQAADDGDAA
jgi:hypothetical protein